MSAPRHTLTPEWQSYFSGIFSTADEAAERRGVESINEIMGAMEQAPEVIVPGMEDDDLELDFWFAADTLKDCVASASRAELAGMIKALAWMLMQHAAQGGGGVYPISPETVLADIAKTRDGIPDDGSALRDRRVDHNRCPRRQVG